MNKRRTKFKEFWALNYREFWGKALEIVAENADSVFLIESRTRSSSRA